jgi:acetyl-CoA carboxylase carboxyltransferase component
MAAKERTREYEERFLSPFVAAERGYIDQVIMPHATRRRVARALANAARQDRRDAVPQARQFADKSVPHLIDLICVAVWHLMH